MEQLEKGDKVIRYTGFLGNGTVDDIEVLEAYKVTAKFATLEGKDRPYKVRRTILKNNALECVAGYYGSFILYDAEKLHQLKTTKERGRLEMELKELLEITSKEDSIRGLSTDNLKKAVEVLNQISNNK